MFEVDEDREAYLGFLRHYMAKHGVLQEKFVVCPRILNKEGRAMRFISLASVVALVVLLVLGCGAPEQRPAGQQHVGRYVKEGSPAEYTELRADGTFVVEERGHTLKGTYQVRGENITLFVGFGGTATGTIKDNTIVDNEGQTWTKQR